MMMTTVDCGRALIRPAVARVHPRIFEDPAVALGALAMLEDLMAAEQNPVVKGCLGIVWEMVYDEAHNEGACTALVSREAVNWLAMALSGVNPA